MKCHVSRATLVAVALSAAMPSWAHHSVSGEFDITKHIAFTGTVQKVGDTVTVQGCRSKNPASTNIGMATLTAADGRTIYSDRSLDTSAGSSL